MEKKIALIIFAIFIVIISCNQKNKSESEKDTLNELPNKNNVEHLNVLEKSETNKDGFKESSEINDLEYLNNIQKQIKEPTFFVSSYGNDENNNGKDVNTPFLTLARAVEVASKSTIKSITIIGTLNYKTEKNKISSKEVFNIDYKGKEWLIIRGIPDVKPELKAVLSAKGTNQRVIFSSGKIYYIDIEISGANTESDGAGIYGNSFCLGRNAKIINNKTSKLGGGVYVTTNCFILENSVISNNFAMYGGGIYVPYSWCKVLLRGGDIQGNNAIVGGGIYIREASNQFLMKSGNIFENTAKINGGGIYTADELIIESGKIYNNTAKNGGGIYAGWDWQISNSTSSGANIKILSCEISNNKAEFGGGIYLDVGKIIFENGEINNNYADYVGGGVYVNTKGSFEQGNSIISENKSEEEAGANLFYQK